MSTTDYITYTPSQYTIHTIHIMINPIILALFTVLSASSATPHHLA